MTYKLLIIRTVSHSVKSTQAPQLSFFAGAGRTVATKMRPSLMFLIAAAVAVVASATVQNIMTTKGNYRCSHEATRSQGKREGNEIPVYIHFFQTRGAQSTCISGVATLRGVPAV